MIAFNTSTNNRVLNGSVLRFGIDIEELDCLIENRIPPFVTNIDIEKAMLVGFSHVKNKR